MDYLGAGVLEPEKMVELVSGVADGCRENGCALLGGETAEMPGFYQPGDYELVGFIVGLVDRPKVLDGSKVQAGDVLVGLPSSGLHTNGYSLARKVVFEKAGLEDRRQGALGQEADGGRVAAGAPPLLPEGRSGPLLGTPALHGMAHITGGGITDNLPRILPEGAHALIRMGSWPIPELFHFLQETGEVEAEEMLRVFNMGVGMILAVDPARLAEILGLLRSMGQKSWILGTLQAGGAGVVYDLELGLASDTTGA